MTFFWLIKLLIIAFHAVISMVLLNMGCPVGFQTRRLDPETGLYDFGLRLYDPRTHTWLSPDPWREAGELNLYAYCQDDPVGNFDPLGLAEWFDVDLSDATALKTFLPFHYGGPLGSRSVALYNHPSGRTVGEDILYARSLAQSSATAMVQGLFYGGATLRAAGGAGEVAAGLAAAPESAGGSLLVAGNGVDNLLAGVRTLSSGQYQPAWLEGKITGAAGNGLLGNGLYAATQLGMGFVPAMGSRPWSGLGAGGNRLLGGGLLPGNQYASQAG